MLRVSGGVLTLTIHPTAAQGHWHLVTPSSCQPCLSASRGTSAPRLLSLSEVSLMMAALRLVVEGCVETGSWLQRVSEVSIDPRLLCSSLPF